MRANTNTRKVVLTQVHHLADIMYHLIPLNTFNEPLYGLEYANLSIKVWRYIKKMHSITLYGGINYSRVSKLLNQMYTCFLVSVQLGPIALAHTYSLRSYDL